MSIRTYQDIIATISDDDVAVALGVLNKQIDSASILDALVDAYRHAGVALVLGAGVSASCGAPSWTELLLRLHAVAAKSRHGVDLSGISSVYAESVSSDGPLISARLAAGGITKDAFKPDESDALKDRVRKEIYDRLPTDAPRSKLVKELARLSQSCEGQAGIRSVVTYNYDTLLEDEFEELGRKFKRLDRNDRGTGLGIEVRHVHGFLGRSRVDGEWLVLTESAYHAEYESPFSWSNIVQLNAFRESTCAFVGLSMTDPNLRRLLEAAKQTATPEHFCFLRRTSGVALQNNLDARWEKQGRPKDEDRERLAARFEVAAAMADTSRAEALRELGVKTIWYSEHVDLPALIKRVREGEKGAAK